ncbi:MAG: phosphate ABC transporter permease subunit PstC, partial [bacterium]|nr:phosphate ABC transporter permease subunit PstC [bacterium]
MRADFIFEKTTKVFAFLSVAIVSLMGFLLLMESWPSIQQSGFLFLIKKVWDPVIHDYGALPFVYGTLVSSGLALIMAIPLSLGVAIFLSELAPYYLRRPIAFLVELLAAIPSVIYGLWGLFYLVPLLREK